MYTRLIRPVLFIFPPESIHRMVSVLLKVFFSIPGIAPLVRRYYTVGDPRLKRRVFGIDFPGPVGIAAGFDKEGSLYNQLSCFGFSHIEIGTVTPRPQRGNPRPRLFRLKADGALINRMGFNNHGIDEFVSNLKKQKKRVIIGGNIGKNTTTPNNDAAADYCHCFEKLYDYVDYFVINVSCPNIKDMEKLQDKGELKKIIISVQELNRAKVRPKPLLVKISPDLSYKHIDEMLEIVKEAGLDGIVATNTTSKRPPLKTSREKLEKIGQGGLSGLPLRDRSTEIISYLHKRTGGNIPIIGSGGIFNFRDAAEKIEAGASLVQVYTGFIYNGPGIARKINRGFLNNI